MRPYAVAALSLGHPGSGYLSQDDEQVPGRRGAVVAAGARAADAVSDDKISDVGLEAFEATDSFQRCCE